MTVLQKSHRLENAYGWETVATVFLLCAMLHRRLSTFTPRRFSSAVR
jgi:hypothetical protein